MPIVGMEMKIISLDTEILFGLEQRKNYVGNLFFDSQGLIQHEFIPQSQTVSKEIYIDIIYHAQNTIGRKQTEQWETKKLGSFA